MNGSSLEGCLCRRARLWQGGTGRHEAWTKYGTARLDLELSLHVDAWQQSVKFSCWILGCLRTLLKQDPLEQRVLVT